MPDKWAKYAQPPPTTTQPPDKWAQYAQPASADTSSPPPQVPTAAPQKGFLESVADSSGLSTVGHALLHPIDTLGNVAGFAGDVGKAALHPNSDTAATSTNPITQSLRGMVNNSVDNVKQGVADYKKEGLTPTTRRDFGRAVPIAGPMLAQAQAQHDAGNDAGMAGTLTGFVAGAVAPDAVTTGLKAVPGALKNIIRGPIDEPIPGSSVTPRERFTAAKDLGVNLPPAQATNSGVLKPLDWINQEGLMSGGMHEKLRGANYKALTNATDATLDKMSPVDAETGGQIVQDKLKAPFTDLQNQANDTLGQLSPLGTEDGGARLQSLTKAKQESLHDDATAGYKDVQDNYGDLPANNSALIVKTAEDIGNKNARFSQQFPSLESRKIMGVVGDAAQLGNESQQAFMGPPTVADLMRSRSALLDLTRDPEIVKSSYAADIQRLIAAHDEAIMGSLPQDGQEAWRGANEKWESMKNNFDNPQSPYYNAIRTPNPSTLTQGVGGTSPEAIKTLRGITGDEGAGIVGRGVAEKMLGRTADGSFDLKNFGNRFERTPEETRNALFSPATNEKLQGISRDYQEMEPFEKSAFTTDPESLTKGIGPETAAGVRQLRDLPVRPEGAAGPAAPRIGEEGMGAVRRGVAEDLLGKTKTEGYNFPTFPGRLARTNEGFRNELFGPETHQTLKDIGTTSDALDTNYNRSGSGKQAQKFMEAGSFLSGLPAFQYPLGKIMTSTKLADALMRDTPTTPIPKTITLPAGLSLVPKSKKRD